MADSMTAFGRARGLSADGTKDITAEIKSVNSRYLDFTVKLPRAYSFLEEKIKAYVISKGITRGKTEVYIGVDVISTSGAETEIDLGAAESYINALIKIRDTFAPLGVKDDITVMGIAQNRELFSVRKPDDDLEKDWEDVKGILEGAVDSFLERRRAEGERLISDISAKIEGIRTVAKKIGELSEKDIASYGDKLTERIKQFLSDFNIDVAEQRVLTEAAIYADKAAIDEELVRLDSHFETYYEMISSPEPVGRKLDFLVQEMNRETNTIGSKAGNSEIAHLVVDVKAELEKIREQVQNIE